MILEITCEANDKWKSCKDRLVSILVENVDQNDEESFRKRMKPLYFFPEMTPLISMRAN